MYHDVVVIMVPREVKNVDKALCVKYIEKND